MLKGFVFLICLLASSGGSAAASISTQVMLNLHSGRKIFAQLQIPETPPERTSSGYPVLLLFGGFQHAAEVLSLVPSQKEMVLASFDYPFDPPRRFKFPESLKLAPDAKQMVYDTLEGIELLLRELRKRQDIDRDKITIVGASLGAPFAALAAGRLAEISGLVLIHGFGEVPSVITHQLMRSWQPKYGSWSFPFAWLLGHLTWNYLGLESPEQAVQNLRLQQKSLVISAEQDSFIPQKASLSLQRAFARRAAHQQIIMQGDHLKPGADQQIEQLMKLTLGWLKEMGLGP